MRPLFFIGNKRSGTSQLVRILNLHPRIYITHESDIAWILFQFHNHRPFKGHPWDSPKGMNLMLETTGSLLRENATPAENFLTLQTHMMEQGNPWLPPQKKPDLEWLGDKKPQQQTDPELLAFVLQHFPNARFIHIVRHPLEVVESSDRFNKTDDGDFWLDLSAEQKLERWAFHEKQVLDLKKSMPDRVCTLRYEDLCRHTRRELLRVFAFLELEPDQHLLKRAARKTRPRMHPPVQKIPATDDIRRVASTLGYDVDRPPGRIRTLLGVTYWHLVKALGAQ